MKKLWILFFVFLYADVVDRGISEATPEEIKRFKEERIKRGFVPPMEKCGYENEDYWIKIVNTCREEGEYYCPSVMILIDKKKDLLSDSNSEATTIVKGIVSGDWNPYSNSYTFKDKNFIYRIDARTTLAFLTIIKDNKDKGEAHHSKTIYEKKLKSCNPNGKIP